MLTRIDRLQVSAGDRRDVVDCWVRLFDAQVVKEDAVSPLAARRTVLRLGESEVEVLEPDGVGPLARFMGRTGGGLFAAGFATADPAALVDRLRGDGRCFEAEEEQLFLSPDALGMPGLQAVVTPETSNEPAGIVRRLYEVTLLAHASDEMAERSSKVFGLDPAAFHPIRSEVYGYQGVLTLFDPDRLDRLEIVTPFDDGRTMGRYFRRKGPRLYMAYAEVDDLGAVRERLLEHSPGGFTGPRAGEPLDNLFVHPQVLGGVMLGLSRVSYAWTWSGHPDRVSTGQPLRG